MSQAIRTSQRCVATTLAGARCKNRTARGTKCWVHLKKENGLRVKTSGVAGMGLFTTKKRKKKKQVATYQGETLTKQQVSARYGNRTGQYVLCRNNRNECRDARKTTAGVARFANDPRGTGKRANVKFSGYSVKTTKSVKPGDELLVSYRGGGYWSKSG